MPGGEPRATGQGSANAAREQNLLRLRKQPSCDMTFVRLCNHFQEDFLKGPPFRIHTHYFATQAPYSFQSLALLGGWHRENNASVSYDCAGEATCHHSASNNLHAFGAFQQIRGAAEANKLTVMQNRHAIAYQLHFRQQVRAQEYCLP